jgi:hypothetical protein
MLSKQKRLTQMINELIDGTLYMKMQYKQRDSGKEILEKLKINAYKNVKFINFSEEFKPDYPSISTNPEVIIYYIEALCDVTNFVKICNSELLTEANRSIMVYRKGRKD